MRNKIIIGVIILVLLLLGNPNKETIEDAAKERAIAYSSNNKLPAFFQGMVSRIVENSITTNNYYLFSVANRQYSNVEGTKVIGVGVLWLYFDVTSKEFYIKK